MVNEIKPRILNTTVPTSPKICVGIDIESENIYVALTNSSGLTTTVSFGPDKAKLMSKQLNDCASALNAHQIDKEHEKRTDVWLKHQLTTEIDGH